jgi:hypothetical protein
MQKRTNTNTNTKHKKQLADGDRILEDDRSLQTGYIFVYCAVPPS